MDRAETYRARIVDSIVRCRDEIRRALTLPPPTTIEWEGREMWIDRVRVLALSDWKAKDLGVTALDTVPASRFDDIEYSGLSWSSATGWDLVRVMAGIIVRDDEPVDFLNGPDLLAFAIMQPLINPAFESIFWLALAFEISARDGTGKKLGEVMGPLVFDTPTYPGSRHRAPEIRAAQVAFVGTYLVEREEPALETPDVWLRASDDDWAARCKAVVDKRADDILEIFRWVDHSIERGEVR